MRYLTAEINRFFAEEGKMAFVAGPRQVGKTTLAKHLLSLVAADSFYFNWDIESHHQEPGRILASLGLGLLEGQTADRPG